MKKILLSLFTVSCFLSNAQTFVSTSPENKNIILEEFTGISCGYCPDGHRIGQELHDLNPNDVFLINIHTGGYASPQGPGTDFRVDPEGANIANQSGLSGYPAGTVNRHQFTMSQGGGTAMSRGDWTNASTQLLAEASPVNIGLQASVDMATNILTVDVEVYYTGSQSISTNMLNIMVVQNGIAGPQSGSSYNPSAIDPVTGLYSHNHMLRHTMTGNWGETISTITQGTFFSNQYTWNMPADINGVMLDPTNIAVIGFIAEGQQEILTGTEVYPNIIFANQNDAYCMSSNANDAICGTTTDIEVTFRNYGFDPLTSLDINYSINGGTASTYPWTGNLASAGTETIIIPAVSFSAQATNTVNITTANPNGTTDQNAANDQANSSFNQYSSAGSVNPGVVPGTASIDIVCDAWGGETTWEITDDAGNIVASGGPYQSMQTAGTYPQATAYATLAYDQCYSFLIKDSYGDGINGAQYGAGSFTITDSNGNTFITGGVFTDEVRENFQANGSATNINNIVSKVTVFPSPVKNILTIEGDYKDIEMYNLFGKLVLSSNNNSGNINVSSLANGIYMLNIRTINGTENKKITISK